MIKNLISGNSLFKILILGINEKVSPFLVEYTYVDEGTKSPLNLHPYLHMSSADGGSEIRERILSWLRFRALREFRTLPSIALP